MLSPTEGVHIRTLTWNVHKFRGRGWRRDPQRVLGVISRLSPDIALLQEADRRIGNDRALLDRETVLDITGLAMHEQEGMVGGGVGWRGNVLLHRPGYRVVDVHHLSLPSPERRGASVWTLDVDGIHIDVVGLHLALVGAWRTLQAAAVAAFIASREERPTIIAGDTNDWRLSSRSLEPLENLMGSRAARIPTFPSFRPLLPLDRIVAGRGASVSSICSIPDRDASDHLPVACGINISGSPSRNPTSSGLCDF